MPLSVNVGLSRKASRDYQSTGFSINLTAELDQSLLARPEELQAQIEGLYQQAGQALDRQVSGDSGPPAQRSDQDRPRADPDRAARRESPGGNGARTSRSGWNGRRNGTPASGRTGGNTAYRRGASRGGAPAGMTDSQRRAIAAIAERLGVDPAEECRQEFGLNLDELSIREASRMIDHLKSLQPAASAQHGNGHDPGNGS